MHSHDLKNSEGRTEKEISDVSELNSRGGLENTHARVVHQTNDLIRTTDRNGSVVGR
jgi:hypothetical protein